MAMAKILPRVSAAIRPLPPNARDTVIWLTPAASAT